MSVILGKRSRWTDDSEHTEYQPFKRKTPNSRALSRKTVPAQSQREENHRRLTLLFPNIEQCLIIKVLDDTNNQLDQAIDQLTSYSQNTQQQLIIGPYSQNLLAALQSATCQDEALGMIHQCLQSLLQQYQYNMEVKCSEQAKSLNSALSEMTKQNSLLKRAIRRLNDKLEDSEKLASGQAEVINNQQMQVYQLKISLQQALDEKRGEWINRNICQGYQSMLK